MQIYPAIDIKDGKCVRLKQGDFSESTVFDDDPSRVAQRWKEAGATYIHVVDLDGARYGSGYNNAAIRSILVAGLPIQVGGGIRCMADVAEKLEMGVARVILGTAAVKDSVFVKEALLRYGKKIAIGIDASNGVAAVEGWAELSRRNAVELCLEMKGLGAHTVIYTDIAKDGMMSGPNIEGTREMIEKTGMQVIASGGISSMADLDAVMQAGSYGAIIGKALYTGNLDLSQVIKHYQKEVL